MEMVPSYARISGVGHEDDMADKIKDTIEGVGKKTAVPESANEGAPGLEPGMKSMKIPKLVKKNKSRLPRREKKAAQKGR